MNKAIYTIKRFLLTVITVGVCSSCDHLLDLDPKENVDSDQLYKSVQYFEYGVVGVYNNLHVEYSTLLGAVLADECKLSQENTGVDGYAVQLNRWTYSSDDDLLHETWKDYYHALYKINTLLENMHRVPQETTADQEALDILAGELKGLRAFVHFELHRIFGESDDLGNQALTIPYVTDTDLFKKPGKLTQADFYTLLWNDIQVAAEHLNNKQAPARFSVDATQALAARVSLYQKNYAQAIAYTSQIINAYPLATTNQYAAMWRQNQTEEVIFKLARNNDDELRPNTLWYNFNTGKTLFYAASKLNQLYTKDDIRATLFFGASDPNQIAKYAGENHENRISDLPVFRSSELYLIRAEAYLKTGATTLALEDLQTLQQARSTATIKPTQIDEAIILKERYKELAFEGHRYFDLKRLGKPLERNKEDLAAPSDLPLLAFGSPQYQLPIPLKEIQSNPNLGNGEW